MINTIPYQARTGCLRDCLPYDLLAKSAVWDSFGAWRKNGMWQNLVDALLTLEIARKPE